MNEIEDRLSIFEQQIESKLNDIELKISEANKNLSLSLEDKVPFKLFLVLLTLIIGNLGFQWAIYEKALQIEYNTEKSILEFNLKIENTETKIKELQRTIDRR